MGDRATDADILTTETSSGSGRVWLALECLKSKPPRRNTVKSSVAVVMNPKTIRVENNILKNRAHKVQRKCSKMSAVTQNNVVRC